MQISDTFIELLEDAGLLLAMVYIYTLLLPRLGKIPEKRQAFIIGILFGIFGIACMISPVLLAPGYRLDNRNVMVALAAVFGGIPGAVLSALLVMAFRLLLGGAGLVGAAASITTTAFIGMLLRHWIRDSERYSPRLLVLGSFVCAQGLTWFLIANPPEVAYPLFEQMALPMLLLYSFTTWLIGTLLFNGIKNQRTEIALKDSLHFVERITQTVPDTLYVYDIDEQRAVYLNRQVTSSLGYSKEQVIEMGDTVLPRLMHPDDFQKHPGRIERERHLKRGEIFEYEFRMRHVNGVWRWLSSHETPFAHNADGTVKQVIGFSRDITEHKRAEAQAQELQLERDRGRLLQQFVSAASHDLRTPITIMKTTLYLLGKELPPEAAAQRRMNEFRAQLDHMHRLVEDMLTMSRLDRPDITLHLERVSLQSAVRTALEQQQSALEQKGHTVVQQLAEMLLLVMVDPTEFGHALKNVLANAINFTPQGGRLTLSACADGDTAVLTLEDNGIGISPEDMPHIFERFYRADKARQAISGGTGLGLSIAQRIVVIHSGQIDIESTQGKGTTVRIRLPLVKHITSQDELVSRIDTTAVPVPAIDALVG